MLGFGKKKGISEEEESGCRFCVYSAEENGVLICQKKRQAKDPEVGCSSYEYDLLKHIPGRMPVFGGFSPENIEGENL